MTKYIYYFQLIFLFFILNGCVVTGVYSTQGKSTSPGLPPMFAAGTDWTLFGDNDVHVNGTKIHISKSGEVVIKKYGKFIPSKIEHEEIALGGDLDGCSIFIKNIGKLCAICIKGKGIDTNGDLGHFYSKNTKQLDLNSAF